jgi:hypothetical protein
MFVEAVILILKHATSLLPNSSPGSALTCAELGYQEANVDLKILQYLAESSQEFTIEQLASFIMATGIGWFIPTSIKTISHQLCAEPSHHDPDPLVPSQSSVETKVKTQKGHWLKQLSKSLRKSTRKDK